MEPRIDYRKYAQEVQKHLYALEEYVANSGLDHRLVLLLKMRRFTDQRLCLLH